MPHDVTAAVSAGATEASRSSAGRSSVVVVRSRPVEPPFDGEASVGSGRPVPGPSEPPSAVATGRRVLRLPPPPRCRHRRHRHREEGWGSATARPRRRRRTRAPEARRAWCPSRPSPRPTLPCRRRRSSADPAPEPAQLQPPRAVAVPVAPEVRIVAEAVTPARADARELAHGLSAEPEPVLQPELTAGELHQVDAADARCIERHAVRRRAATRSPPPGRRARRPRPRPRTRRRPRHGRCEHRRGQGQDQRDSAGSLSRRQQAGVVGAAAQRRSGRP